MSDSYEKVINDIVDATLTEDFTLQEQFYLTQSLLALARMAHTTGYDLGCRDTLKKITGAFDSTNALDADAIAELAMRSARPH